MIKLLNVVESEGAIALNAPSFPRNPPNIALSGRSFLGVMTFLAQHVEVPAAHQSLSGSVAYDTLFCADTSPRA